MGKRLFIVLLFLSSVNFLMGQSADQYDSSGSKILSAPEKFINTVSSKTKEVEKKLDKKSEKALAAFKKQEQKIIRKISSIDSVKGKLLQEAATLKYKILEDKLKSKGKLTQYIPHLDSLSTSLDFLAQNNSLISQAKEIKGKLDDAISSMDGVKAQLQKADNIKQFLKERKDYLKQQLEKFGFAKQLKKLNKQVYYYSLQVNEYKEILKDPRKIEKKALAMLSKTRFFQDFMRKNSMMASLFPMPGVAAGGSGGGNNGFAGLQTRTQILSFINNMPGAAPNGQGFSQVLQRNIQSVQGITDQFKNKINGMFDGSGMEMPDFKVNNQKVKSFWKRLELGSNFQSQRAGNFFPTTTDVGLSLGYKISDKNIIGLGTSMKIGWGKDFQHINISGQGFSLRSFLDINLKKSFYASGGFEYNYQESFSAIRTLYNVPAWKKSGLIGISKIVSLKNGFLKKAKLYLLYDFFSENTLPVTQPIIFRIGYNF